MLAVAFKLTYEYQHKTNIDMNNIFKERNWKIIPLLINYIFWYLKNF